MTATYIVTSTQPIFINPHGMQPALTLFNSSTTNTVWVADTAAGNDGFPMSPGMLVGWDAGRALYAYAQTGLPATLYVTENAGNVVSAAAIATQILSGGLASAIADAVYLKGIPAVDVPAILVNDVNLSAPLSVDVSTYQSITISGIVDAAASSTLYLSLTDLFQPVAGPVTVTKIALDPSGEFNLAIPLRASTLSFSASGGTVHHFTVIGHYRAPTMIEGWIQSGAADTNPNLPTDSNALIQALATASIPALTTYSTHGRHRVGPARILLQLAPVVAAPGIDVYFQDIDTGAIIAGQTLCAGAAGATFSIDVDLPLSATAFCIRNRNGGAISVAVAIVWER